MSPLFVTDTVPLYEFNSRSIVQSLPPTVKVNTVELEWLEQAGTMKISLSQRYFQPSRIAFYICYIRDFCGQRFRAVIYIFYFSDRRSLKIENKNNSMKT